MRYLIGALTGALLLAACAGITPNKAVFDARGAYDVLLNGAAAYSTLPRCEEQNAPKICSKQAVVDQMRKADAAAKATLDAAEDTVRNHPDMNASAAIAAAQNAVTALSVIFDVYGIKKGS